MCLALNASPGRGFAKSEWRNEDGLEVILQAEAFWHMALLVELAQILLQTQADTPRLETGDLSLDAGAEQNAADAARKGASSLRLCGDAWSYFQ